MFNKGDLTQMQDLSAQLLQVARQIKQAAPYTDEMFGLVEHRASLVSQLENVLAPYAAALQLKAEATGFTEQKLTSYTAGVTLFSQESQGCDFTVDKKEPPFNYGETYVPPPGQGFVRYASAELVRSYCRRYWTSYEAQYGFALDDYGYLKRVSGLTLRVVDDYGNLHRSLHPFYFPQENS